MIVTTRRLCQEMDITHDTLAEWKAAGCPVHCPSPRRNHDLFNVFSVLDWLRQTQRARYMASISAALRRSMQNLRP